MKTYRIDKNESFRAGGTLARLARRGVHVYLLTVTRGEAGSCGDPLLCTLEELPAEREAELHCACAALGIEPPITNPLPRPAWMANHPLDLRRRSRGHTQIQYPAWSIHTT